jgi:hypothetical protein
MACSTSRGKVATMLGAYRCPGHTDVRARGLTVSPTASPACMAAFYPERLARRVSPPYSCLIIVREQQVRSYQPSYALKGPFRYFDPADSRA